MFGMPGHWEMLIILFVGLLLFGHRVPGAARSLGRGIVEFRKGLKGEDDDEEKRDPDRLEKGRETLETEKRETEKSGERRD
ncbi:MAG: twin-arginine translocase TatA/TatE family subunit [Planctomycetes bacterium]|nr:twin-arginine translocase TatA/TatE family subunit [Planctomycetota bacterium]